MDLATAVERYLAVTGGFDLPLHLSDFGLTKAETESTFSAWDEDYQISRYLFLSRQPDEELARFDPELRVFLINGHQCTHVTLRGDIRRLVSLA